MFLDVFEKACTEIGLAPTRVLKDLNMGKSTLTNWRNGHEPSNRAKQQIANYFGVTVSEFLAGKIKNPAIENDDGTKNNIDSALADLLRQLTPDEAIYARGLLQGLIAARKK